MLNLTDLPVDMIKWMFMTYSDAQTGIMLTVYRAFCFPEGAVCVTSLADFLRDESTLKDHASRIALTIAKALGAEVFDAIGYDGVIADPSEFTIRFVGSLTGTVNAVVASGKGESSYEFVSVQDPVRLSQENTLHAIRLIASTQAYSYVCADRTVGSPGRNSLMAILQEDLDKRDIKVFSVSNAVHVVLYSVDHHQDGQGLKLVCAQVLDKDGNILHEQPMMSISRGVSNEETAGVKKFRVPDDLRSYLEKVKISSDEFAEVVHAICLVYLLNMGISRVGLDAGKIEKFHRVADIKASHDGSVITVSYCGEPIALYTIQDIESLKVLKNYPPKQLE